MVALQCPLYTKRLHRTKPTWTHHGAQATVLPEESGMGFLLPEGTLLIPNASVSHQGNYSCSVG